MVQNPPILAQEKVAASFKNVRNHTFKKNKVKLKAEVKA